MPTLVPYHNRDNKFFFHDNIKRNFECFKVSKTAKYAIVVLLLSIPGLLIDYRFSENLNLNRSLSIDLGNGKCEWSGAAKIDVNSDPYGTLFVSYPGSGMRLTWQMTEGASGVQVGDDFFYSGKTINGLVKTQYPHPEGIWSYGKAMDQVILLIRNPRWNIPSYHTLIYELEYAHDYVTAYDNVFTAFSTRAPMDNWLKWRDYRFEDELNLWTWQIDFWMENGTRFWDDLDFERAGQYPFSYFDEVKKPWPLDNHCRNDLDCVPKAIISYERLKHPDTGASELRKIVDLIRFKKEMKTILANETMECVWNETLEHAPQNRNEDRDASGLFAEDYKFTVKQMELILARLTVTKHKYTTGDWVLNPMARDLVVNFHAYIRDVASELASMYVDPPPTRAPVADMYEYRKSQVEWYNSIGKGNKYAKDIVQQMAAYWPTVEDLYNGTEPDAIYCNDNSTSPDLTLSEQEWVDGHNIRRTSFYELHGMGPADLEWSADLASSAQNYAQQLLNETGCWIQHGLNADVYGTQNLASNNDANSASPSEVLEVWYENEIDLDRMELVGKKFHASQILFRSTRYLGCAQASKEDPDAPGGMCHFHVCRYTGPGNCFLETFIDVYPNFVSLMPENCMEDNPNNYWLCSVLSEHASVICQEPPHLPMSPTDKCI